VTANLTQNLPAAMKSLFGRTRHTVVEGRVFQDDAARGHYVEGMPPLANVEVVLDGTQRTRTDATGRFRFRGVPEGRHRVEARFSSDSPYFYTGPNPVVPRDGAMVNIGIGFSRARLFGLIVNDVSKGIGDVTVEVAGPEGQRVARTGGDGTFTLDGLQPGTYEVRIDPTSVPPGYPVQNLKSQMVEIEASRPGRAEFVLRPLRSVLGHVRAYHSCSASYVPVRGVEVTLGATGSISITDDAGRYVFRDLAPGPHTLTASYGGRTATVTVTLPDAAALLKDVTLTLAPARDHDSDGSCVQSTTASQR
jgi:protocatechuate 3,4-dioxygenase beta subunit